MFLTDAERAAWLQWVCITSVPMVQLGGGDTILGLGSAMLVNHRGCRFALAAEHVVRRDSAGWALVVGQDGRGQLEYYRPNFFTYVGEVRLSTGEVLFLDLCAAQVSPTLVTRYEFRTPRGLFEQEPHHVFESSSFSAPDGEQVYAFSGRVRTERHGPDVYVSEMVVYPGLKYSHSTREVHHFKLPVEHPGHEAFQGCSGSPIVDLNRNVVALVIRGDEATDSIQGVAIDRVLPNLDFLAAQSGA